MKPSVRNIVLFLGYFMLGMPLLYYAYKYGTPEFGGSDVYSYYKLYATWDFKSVDSPFNQRLISAWCIHMIHLSGISYNTETAVAGSNIDPQIYFSALLFNFLCVVATAIVIFKTTEKFLATEVSFNFVSGLVFLLGFGTLLFLVTALSDALSVLMIAGIFYFYLAKSRWQYLILVAAIFQREYVFMVFVVVAAVDWFFKKEERKYFLAVVLMNIACFVGYIICRKTIFFTPRYEHQMDIAGFFGNITQSIQDIGAYMRQTFMLQNILILYFAIIAYKMFRKLETNKIHLLIIVLLIAQIVVLSLLIGLGNNTGRYFYMGVPILVFYLASEVKPLFTRNPKEITS